MKVYAIDKTGQNDDMLPVFVITDGRLYRTVNHREGWAADPDYEMHPDGRFYRTRHHRNGPGSKPDYEFRQDQLLYRTPFHPDGQIDRPEFAIYD